MTDKQAHTAELVRRSLSPETAATFRERLAEQAEWLRTAISDGQFDNAEDVSLPVEATGYTIYVHGADGEGWKREDWQEEFGE